MAEPSPAPVPARRRFPWAGLAFGLLAAAYPLGVYLSLTRWGARAAALLVLAFLGLWALRAGLHRRSGGRVVLVQVAGLAALSLVTLATGHPAFLQQAPVLVSLFLLGTFAYSLRRPPPMIERYARLVKKDLSPAEVAHCRAFTWAWAAFFVVNATLAEATVVLGRPDWWAAYAGGIAYGLMGLLFAVEWTIRQVRFGDRRRWRSAFHTVAFYAPWAVVGPVVTILVFPPLWLASRAFPGVLRPFRAFVRRFYGAQMRALTFFGAIRIAPVEGVDRLLRGGPMVVVANHRTLLDVLILMSLVPDASCLLKPVKKPPEGEARRAMPGFWKPFILAPFSLLGYVPMPPDWGDREALRATFDRCRDLLRAGRPLVIFPEGTRSPDGRLLPFRDFPFRLALDAGVPLVPVVIHTDTRFMPQGSVGIDAARRCTFRLRVLPDVVPDARTRASDLLVEVRRRLQREVARLDEAHGSLEG